MHENLSARFPRGTLRYPAHAAGEAVELAGRNDPRFPLIWEQQLQLAKPTLTLSEKIGNVESKVVIFLHPGLLLMQFHRSLANHAGQRLFPLPPGWR